ncbi:dentin sialophosphoprotein-like isoform X7 [Denticeps clupeoides]|uniref:dentin sialophosphoprotein-like isoform X7 n=1 Tax=Denticeps clupeoides TaxID=299321 RepID=UPI0010A4128C|nr:dentin sialophosphoprotein-like isoform X7 [Denticeps clupeoides]
MLLTSPFTTPLLILLSVVTSATVKDRRALIDFLNEALDMRLPSDGPEDITGPEDGPSDRQEAVCGTSSPPQPSEYGAGGASHDSSNSDDVTGAESAEKSSVESQDSSDSLRSKGRGRLDETRSVNKENISAERRNSADDTEEPNSPEQTDLGSEGRSSEEEEEDKREGLKEGQAGGGGVRTPEAHSEEAEPRGRGRSRRRETGREDDSAPQHTDVDTASEETSDMSLHPETGI